MEDFKTDHSILGFLFQEDYSTNSQGKCLQDILKQLFIKTVFL
jgi:hypothetical protein